MAKSSEPVKEMVNHPNHYQTASGIEAIDVMEAFTEGMTGPEAVNTSNVIRYILRWKHKNGLEDLKKARWYIERLISLVEKEERKASNVEEAKMNTTEERHHYRGYNSLLCKDKKTWDDITFDTLNEAEEVLSHMQNLVSQFEAASIDDLLNAVGSPSYYTASLYGWTNLTGATIEKIRDDCYKLNLPDVHFLDPATPF